MKRRTLVAALGSTLAIAAACSPFSSPEAGGADAGGADAGGADAGGADASAVSVDTGVCQTVDDTFSRTATDVVEAPWTNKVQDTGCSISIVPDNDGGGFAQAQVDATGNGVPAPSDAYLVTTLSVVPKSLTCSFRFRPDTDFHTGDPGLDFFIIEIDHEDSTSVLLRFSFKDGDLEIRDDHLDRNEQCAPCSVTDPKTPASDIAQNKWSNITVTTDFVNVSVSSDATTVHDVVQNVGTPSQVRLRLGLVNFGAFQQLGSFDDFHCTTSC